MKPKLLLLPECMIYGAAREEREGIMDLVMCVVSLLLRKRMGARRSERGVIRYAAGACCLVSRCGTGVQNSVDPEISPMLNLNILTLSSELCFFVTVYFWTHGCCVLAS
jgi:hypothetical protein